MNARDRADLARQLRSRAAILQQDEQFSLAALLQHAAVAIDGEEIVLGVIEFHTRKNRALIDDFFAVTKDCSAAGCIVDIWLMDIATILDRHGYVMTIRRKQ